MWTAYCDDYLLYDPRLPDYILTDPELTMEINKAGSFTFTIYPAHPSAGHISKLKSIITVYQDDVLRFRGRVLDDNKRWRNQRSVTCEGELAFLNDSKIAPFAFPDDFLTDTDYQAAAQNGNVVQFLFAWILNQHNGQVQSWQQLQPGNVTVTDPNNYIARAAGDYCSAWQLLNEKLLKTLGGYLVIRHEGGSTYLDYLVDLQYTNVQTIDFGKNLLDLSQKVDAANIFTAMIPLGAELDQEDGSKKRLDLSAMNNGTVSGNIVKSGKYLYDSVAVSNYGWICADITESTWDDVTYAEHLQTKAATKLANVGVMLANTLTVRAVDLHLSDSAVAALQCGCYVMVNSSPHGLSGSKILKKLRIKLDDPLNSTIEIGDSSLSLTDQNSSKYSDSIKRIEKTEINIQETRKKITTLAQETLTQSTSIINDCQSIILTALEEYVKTSEYESYKETIASEFAVMADKINLTFAQTTERIDSVNGDLQAKYNTITKYFSFSINGLEIGDPNAPYKMVLTEEKISIYNQNMEVLWIKELDTHIPYLAVTEAFNLFGYLVTDDEGTVNCRWAGTGVYAQ